MLRIACVIPKGENFRYVIYLQGCERRCAGCKNPSLWAHDAGRLVSIEDIVEAIASTPIINGVVIVGDALKQAEAISQLISEVHALGLPVWIETGNEEILDSKEKSRI